MVHPLGRGGRGTRSWSGKPLRDFLETERSPSELMDWMRDLMPELESPLATFMVSQHEIESELPAEETPMDVEPTQLLPVRARLIPGFFKNKEERLVAWVISMVEVLNFHANSGKVRLGPPSLTAAQKLMLTRLFTAVQRFDEKGGKVETFSKCRTEIGAVRFDYSGEPIQYMEELEAEKVLPCWPRPGKLGWMTPVLHYCPRRHGPKDHPPAG